MTTERIYIAFDFWVIRYSCADGVCVEFALLRDIPQMCVYIIYVLIYSLVTNDESIAYWN